MKTVLIFGGNGFIGSETLMSLSTMKDLELYLINRDRSWSIDSRAKLMAGVTHLFKWNRKKPLGQYKEITLWLETIKEIDYVIDFSGYSSFYVEDAIHTLGAKVKLYIYISTDSVYEVCVKNHANATQESDDIRPEDLDERRRLAKSDSYGYKKWKCEEVLKKSGVKYVILRLADVIGPNDSTDRWIQLQLWIKAASTSRLPIYLPSDIKDRRISLIYVKDVAQLIASLVSGYCESDQAENNAFNIAFKETTTISELIDSVATKMGCDSCRVEYINPASTVQFYPSVENGPLDISKAENVLQWKPTSLEKAISFTVEAYEESLLSRMNPDTRADLFHSILDDTTSCYTGEDMVRFKKELGKLLRI